MNRKKLTVAYSPCPNDTFMFHDIAMKKLVLPRYHVDVHMHDVEMLNTMALSETFDITKLSLHAYLKVRDQYQILNSGAALGYGCGPLVVTREERAIENLTQGTIAIPGELTTAHLLFQLWTPDAGNIVFMPFDQIMGAVISGDVDVGVVIHEGRFVYRELGLRCLADLGEWWQERTDLPLPLGCIAARKSLGPSVIDSFDQLLRQSIENASAAPDKTFAYVRQHAQEIDESVFVKHIKTYVNEFSIDLGAAGREAIKTMEEEAVKAGVLK